MSSTLLRLGLWVIVIVLALYVVHETYEDTPAAEYIPIHLLQKALVLGGVLMAAGVVFRLLEKGAKVVIRNRCAVCRKPIGEGAIYCREHLRAVLLEEDERTRMTKIRKR